MPTVTRSGAHLLGQVVEVDLFLLCCECVCLAWIEADCDHFIFFADLKRQHAKRSDHTVEYLRAEHRARVVDEREHDWFLAEVLAKFYLLTAFITKSQIKRQLLIEL